jgi:hypothetical protein
MLPRESTQGHTKVHTEGTALTAVSHHPAEPLHVLVLTLQAPHREPKMAFWGAVDALGATGEVQPAASARGGGVTERIAVQALRQVVCKFRVVRCDGCCCAHLPLLGVCVELVQAAYLLSTCPLLPWQCHHRDPPPQTHTHTREIPTHPPTLKPPLPPPPITIPPPAVACSHLPLLGVCVELVQVAPECKV